ncbi:hypothetical protein BKA66DRAFT_127003 [Pyrenochaeta sp. MPI-SDFR-AT-0127]|nr:hypothetical protein BKA66DRAFT_127003 [Pyrenochaeta sp. MPI-SDFR-AT-0127]
MAAKLSDGTSAARSCLLIKAQQRRSHEQQIRSAAYLCIMAWRSRSAAPEEAPPLEVAMLLVGCQWVRVERVGMTLDDLECVCKWRGRVPFGELAEARELSPGRLGRASTAALLDEILVVSRRLDREALAGKVKLEREDVEIEVTGPPGSGREVMIINSILARCSERLSPKQAPSAMNCENSAPRLLSGQAARPVPGNSGAAAAAVNSAVLGDRYLWSWGDPGRNFGRGQVWSSASARCPRQLKGLPVFFTERDTLWIAKGGCWGQIGRRRAAHLSHLQAEAAATRLPTRFTIYR